MWVRVHFIHQKQCRLIMLSSAQSTLTHSAKDFIWICNYLLNQQFYSGADEPLRRTPLLYSEIGIMTIHVPQVLSNIRHIADIITKPSLNSNLGIFDHF